MLVNLHTDETLLVGGGHSEYILVGVCLAHTNGGPRCGNIPKKGVLGAGTPPKKGGLRNVHSPKREVLRNWSCTKGGSWELSYHIYLRLLVNMICRLKRGVLGTGTTRRGGGLRGAPKKRGLRCGSGKTKWAFTAAHTCTGHICESPPHTHNVGSGTTEKYGTWNLL